VALIDADTAAEEAIANPPEQPPKGSTGGM
jgi:hypothetical protein